MAGCSQNVGRSADAARDQKIILLDWLSNGPAVLVEVVIPFRMLFGVSSQPGQKVTSMRYRQRFRPVVFAGWREFTTYN
jgi:hypothetical protein